MTNSNGDLFFRAVQALPSVREYILQLKFKPMPKYTRGLVLAQGHPAEATQLLDRAVALDPKAHPIVDRDSLRVLLLRSEIALAASTPASTLLARSV